MVHATLPRFPSACPMCDAIDNCRRLWSNVLDGRLTTRCGRKAGNDSHGFTIGMFMYKVAAEGNYLRNQNVGSRVGSAMKFAFIKAGSTFEIIETPAYAEVI